MTAYLRNLLPTVRIDYGHGQMPERQLESAMLNFLDDQPGRSRVQHDHRVRTRHPERKHDHCINRADRFGLAQLYQLRGRVGRSNHRAYAYLLIPRDRALSAIARRRLGAIEEFTELASGYKLAMRDLEIRGAGNILGAEQHGHMLAIGFNLYGRLLREAVQELKGERVPEEPEATVNIKVDAYIPDAYIADNDMKIDIYKRVRDAADERALSSLAEELEDRFGAPPGEVEALLDVQAVRLLCRAAGVRESGCPEVLWRPYSRRAGNRNPGR